MIKLLFSASISAIFFGLFGVSWNEVDERIASEFPTVAFVTGPQLLETLATDSGSDPVLIDVREPEEFAVSHLSKAYNLTDGAAIAALIPDKSAPIVVYCSVGYRSAGIAAELQRLGYSNVRNLQHSLFEWANRGYPMENAAGPTSHVHPFNRAWGALVSPDLRSYSP